MEGWGGNNANSEVRETGRPADIAAALPTFLLLPEATPVKKKKKTPSSKSASSGYNPAVPLPVGMEVVGRSASTRRK